MSIRDEYLPELVLAIQDLARRAAADARAVRFQTADFGGTRTLADTTLILRYRDDDYAAYLRTGPAPILSKAAFRPIAAYGSSYHNFGAAFDAEPTSIDGVDVHKRSPAAPIWKTEPARASRLYQAAHDVLDRHAAAAGLRVGDSFQNPDEPHFELSIALEEARRRWTLYTQTREVLSPSSSSPSSSSSSSGLPGAGGK